MDSLGSCNVARRSSCTSRSLPYSVPSHPRLSSGCGSTIHSFAGNGKCCIWFAACCGCVSLRDCLNTVNVFSVSPALTCNPLPVAQNASLIAHCLNSTWFAWCKVRGVSPWLAKRHEKTNQLEDQASKRIVRKALMIDAS